MQRPRCSMKAPNRRGWVVPMAKSRCRRTSTLRMRRHSVTGLRVGGLEPGAGAWRYVRRQDRRLQELRIGMLRVVEHSACVTGLHGAAALHDQDAVADV